MNQNQLDYIFSNHKWPFRYSDVWNKYFVFLFPAVLTILAVAIPIGSGHLTLFAAIWSVILLSVAIYFFNYNLKQINGERKFYSIPVTPDQMNNICNYLSQLGWDVVREDQNVVVARTRIFLTSCGDNITIIKTKNELLFNSRPIKDENSENRFSKNYWAFYDLLKKTS